VDVRAVIAVVQKNVARAQETLRVLATSLPDPAKSPATGVLEHAMMTDLARLTPTVRARYEPIFGKYWRKAQTSPRV
jgi:hypothetical protein